ncbi:hypothetical protein HanRHA438_Chr01g0016521 [Helianthus annuus]|uniref:Uncharacterized protein n=1 Tax=Helianthus annuus TaxID=4232 RepID=A0A9K3JUF0_HELAN|nr:hypothetical protein HanXRQr2_Chr01g0016181 [Helianthus annuus]KAJ0622254.1 hypothetical protein HanIR_Chr01g0017921 [Helianthus annuus]KAJ0626546.1 hypothetical protein HanHA89_Chr01g0014391 [Helianthus annuus]KAJ0782881.1 hypothetical protein HanLR1_Chr01g0013231 [Helianthus annuus]KAJ0947557.1 hypothetical protein HanRHA438_Chr01g0016521 [Helianthus annuus]
MKLRSSPYEKSVTKGFQLLKESFMPSRWKETCYAESKIKKRCRCSFEGKR